MPQAVNPLEPCIHEQHRRKIYREVQQLPENLAREVYDFLRFIEARNGIDIPAEETAVPTTTGLENIFRPAYPHR